MRTIEPANYRVLATGLRFPEGPVAMADGSVLLVEIARGTLTRVSPEGEGTVAVDVGGGPNGAAIGADGAVYVANNGGSFQWIELGDLTVPHQPAPESWPGHGSLQRVDLSTGEVTDLYRECDGHPLRGPNDLVLSADGTIWFTDHGVRQDRTTDRTGIYWAAPDGSEIREVAFPLDAPNGIGLSPDGSRLYAAETHTGRVWAWDVEGPGQLSQSNPVGAGSGELLYGAGGYDRYDSLAVDGEGWVCVATLGNGGITSISPDGSEVEFLPLPDPVTTNICFGPDGTTAYVTLSGTGQLAAFDWHRPGGTLAFTA